jgi:hypothetical protein
MALAGLVVVFVLCFSNPMMGLYIIITGTVLFFCYACGAAWIVWTFAVICIFAICAGFIKGLKQS